MFENEIKGLYNIEHLKDLGLRKIIYWYDQKMLMQFRRDLFDTILTLYAIDNAEPFNKNLKKVSIKEFLEAVQRNYEDDNYTYIMKNRLEGAVAFYLGREVYYEEDFFNSPSSSDPDMVFQMVANSIFKATEKIDFEKDKYKTANDGSRNTTETILQDLTEDLGALEFCENVINEDVKNMLSNNYKVDSDPEIPSYFKHKHKYNPKDIAIFINNEEKIHALYEKTYKYYAKIQNKLMRKTKRNENIDKLVKFFVKSTKDVDNQESEDMQK